MCIRDRVIDVLLEGTGGEQRHRLDRLNNGVHTGFVAGVIGGSRYQFSIDGSPGVPDPRSRYQPEGVHGPSEVIDLAAFAWTDSDWPGIRNQKLSIYELHVGTYTPGGTFEAL